MQKVKSESLCKQSCLTVVEKVLAQEYGRLRRKWNKFGSNSTCLVILTMYSRLEWTLGSVPRRRCFKHENTDKRYGRAHFCQDCLKTSQISSYYSRLTSQSRDSSKRGGGREITEEEKDEYLDHVIREIEIKEMKDTVNALYSGKRILCLTMYM